MKKSAKRSILAVASATLAVAGALAVTMVIPAEADDVPVVNTDVARPISLEDIYRGTGVISEPPRYDDAVEIPGFGTFGGLGQTYQIQLQNNYQEALRTLAGWYDALSLANSRIQAYFPDTDLHLSEPGEPAFLNWKFDNGSEVIEYGAPASSSSPEGGTTYNFSRGVNGTITADYGARATINGNDGTIFGKYTVEGLGMGSFNGYGSIGLSGATLSWPDGPNLQLSSYVNILNADNYGISLGKNSFGFGIVGHTKDQHQVGVSGAFGPNGLMGLSLGGVVQVPGFPAPLQLRVDVSKTGVGLSTNPAPGVTVSGNTTGTFRLELDVNVFYLWFDNLVKGK